MKLELEKLYENGLIDKTEYLEAELVLRHEHRLEMEKENK